MSSDDFDYINEWTHRQNFKKIEWHILGMSMNKLCNWLIVLQGSGELRQMGEIHRIYGYWDSSGKRQRLRLSADNSGSVDAGWIKIKQNFQCRSAIIDLTNVREVLSLDVVVAVVILMLLLFHLCIFTGCVTGLASERWSHRYAGNS